MLFNIVFLIKVNLVSKLFNICSKPNEYFSFEILNLSELPRTSMLPRFSVYTKRVGFDTTIRT